LLIFVNNYWLFGQNISRTYYERRDKMFYKKRKCMNPYVTILVLGMAAVGVVCMVDKCRTMCEEKMQMMREKLPVMFREEE
jgi:uncharacterized membrane protein (DUF106 family)